MPRKVIPLVVGEYYHVYNRGVDKRDIFETESDYMRFYVTLRDFNSIPPVESLRDVSKINNKTKIKKLVDIKAYALLPNHFHLLIRECHEGGISEFMKRIQGGYTSHFNKVHNRNGSLLQGTFKRVHIDSNEYYNYLFSYINENNVVHGIIKEEKIYYSSSLHYQQIVRSKVIVADELDNYDLGESRSLARDIYERRKEMKKYLFDD